LAKAEGGEEGRDDAERIGLLKGDDTSLSDELRVEVAEVVVVVVVVVEVEVVVDGGNEKTSSDEGRPRAVSGSHTLVLRARSSQVCSALSMNDWVR
jgi:hypothetical protein